MTTNEGMLAAGYGVQGMASIGSAYSEASAYAAQGTYESSAYEINARFAELERESAEKRGMKSANRLLKDVKNLQEEQTLLAGASGIDPNSGSAQAIKESAALVGEVDAATIRNNAYREAFGYQVQKDNYLSQARFTRMAAKQKSRSTLLTGGLNALGSGTKASYYAFREEK